MIDGLKAAYNLTTILAYILAFGGFILLRRFTRISLYEVGRHGCVEHDASLVHADTPKGEVFAPIKIHRDLVAELIEDVRSTTKFIEGPNGGARRMLMDAKDVARARVRREKESAPLDGLHAEIARGEMALVLNMFQVRDQGGAGIPTEWMREWIEHERLPTGWKPDPNHKTGLMDTVKQSKAIKQEMDRLREVEKREPWPSARHTRADSAGSTFSTATTGTAFSRESSPRTAVGDDEDEKEF
jgi:hypothetical protein